MAKSWSSRARTVVWRACFTSIPLIFRFRLWLRRSNKWNIWRIRVALPQNMNKTLLVIQCSGHPVLTCWYCDTLAFENAKTLYWLSERRLIPSGLLGKISSSSRKTNHKCAANVAQTTGREYVTSARAILLCYFIIRFLFFPFCFGSDDYYHSYVSYNKQLIQFN